MDEAMQAITDAYWQDCFEQSEEEDEHEDME